MKMIFTILFACLASPLAFAGWDNGNAGDAWANEFELTAKDLVQRLELASKNGLPIPHVAKLRAALVTTTVTSKKAVFLEGEERDAVNYPSQGLIELGRDRWNDLRRASETKNRMRLVLHEYLWIIGEDDTGFRISQGMIDLLDIKNFNPNIWWNPVNPVNTITAAVLGAPQGCTIPPLKIDLRVANAQETQYTVGTCGEFFRKIQVTVTTGITPTSSNIRGEFNSYDVHVYDRHGEIGRFEFEPEWGKCLLPESGGCRASGKIGVGGIDFNFWFLRDSF